MRPLASKVPKGCFTSSDKLARVEIKLEFNDNYYMFFREVGFLDYKFKK
jgi:hypothetical protein